MLFRSVTFTAQEFRDRFLAVYPAAKLNGDAGSFLTDITRNDAGFVSTLRVGGVTVRGNELRTILGLRSPSFTVEVSGETKSCRVTVPDHQLSLAIGNKGQNVRLCAHLTGYNIDIRPESGYYGEDEE